MSYADLWIFKMVVTYLKVKGSEEQRRQLAEAIRSSVVNEHGVDVHHLVSMLSCYTFISFNVILLSTLIVPFIVMLALSTVDSSTFYCPVGFVYR